ncbi:MAG: response regulator [Anaerolineales bacterium]|nr:response regulator [Anaerolineales bacterium]
MTKIMLIEDDYTMLSLLITFLEVEGYEVVQVNSGENAYKAENVLSILRRESPSLALMDVNLKYANGHELLRSVRDAPDLNDVKVLMSSGMDFTYQSLQDGADGFILKPYMPDELKARIQDILGN